MINQRINSDDDQKPRKELLENLSRLRGGWRRRDRCQELYPALTEHRKIEMDLRDTEERFRSFMGNSPAIARFKDDQGRYVYISNRKRGLNG